MLLAIKLFVSFSKRKEEDKYECEDCVLLNCIFLVWKWCNCLLSWSDWHRLTNSIILDNLLTPSIGYWLSKGCQFLHQVFPKPICLPNITQHSCSQMKWWALIRLRLWNIGRAPDQKCNTDTRKTDGNFLVNNQHEDAGENTQYKFPIIQSSSASTPTFLPRCKSLAN